MLQIFSSRAPLVHIDFRSTYVRSRLQPSSNSLTLACNASPQINLMEGGETSMDTGDWRSQLPPDARQRLINKIIDTLKRRLPCSGEEGLLELKKISARFEEKMYVAATSQSDYLRKISLKMLAMETKFQTSPSNLKRHRVDLMEGGELSIDTGAWRSQLLPDVRQKITNKIIDTLKRHLPFSGEEGLLELKRIAARFEGKMYVAATSQSDYLRKITLKMLTMESKSQTTMETKFQTSPYNLKRHRVHA